MWWNFVKVNNDVVVVADLWSSLWVLQGHTVLCHLSDPLGPDPLAK